MRFRRRPWPVPDGAVILAPALLGLLLAGCGPGSGGSGVPSGVDVPATGTPVPAPPPTTAPEPAPPDDCSAPPDAVAEAWQGRIQAVSDTCLVVADRAIRIDGALVIRRAGPAASIDDLLPGLLVTVEPVPGEPGRALRVVIEDGVVPEAAGVWRARP